MNINDLSNSNEKIIETLDNVALKIKTENKELVSTLFGGFVDVQPECVTILTDSAEWVDSIDIERAEAAKERAEERLKKNNSSNIDVARAELALKRAMIRLSLK